MVLQSNSNADTHPYRAPDFEVSSNLKGRDLEIIITPPQKYHFNLKAPMSITRIEHSDKFKPIKVTNQEIQFKLISPETGDYRIELYLCDDAETLCEKHQTLSRWDKKTSKFTIQNQKPNNLSQLLPPTNLTGKEKGRTKDETGFWINHPQQALSEAQEKKKPLLILFSTIWCPACNDLATEVLSSPEFKIQSSQFILLKLDADLDISWNLKSKYKVGAYPTLVFATSEGEEINRIVGFRTRNIFLKIMNQAWYSRNKSHQQWVEAAQLGNREALDHLGLMHFERKEFHEAAQMLEKSITYRELYFESLLSQFDESEHSVQSSDKLISVIIHSLKEFPNSPASIERRFKLASIYARQKQFQLQKQVLHELILKAKEISEKLTEKSALPFEFENQDTSPGELWTQIADAYELLNNSKESKSAWQHAAIEYKKRIRSELDRGNYIELAYCLWKSGDFNSAEEIYKKFEKLFPKEFTFYFDHATMKLSQKNLPEAEQLAKKSLQYSYGDNQIRATYLLAQILQSQGNSSHAKTVAENLVQSLKLPNDPSIRTFRYLKQLQNLISTSH